MHLEDGSKIAYLDGLSRPNLYNWGWIGNKIPLSIHYLSDTERNILVNQIKNIDKKYIVEHCMGHHTCEICGVDNYYFNGSIYILYNKILYVAPAGVHHYIEFHNYTPPRIILKAIKNGINLTEKELKTFNKRDKEFQTLRNKRYADYKKEQEIQRIQEERDEENRKLKAQAKLDRINKHMNSGNEFEKRLKELFLISTTL